MSRITFGQLNSVVQANLMRNTSKVSDLQEKLSSGRAINRPSDAPIDATNDLDLRSTLGSLSQWQRNTEDGSAYLAIIDTTLTQSADLFQKARQSAVQAASDTLTAQDRQYMLKDVQASVLDQMLTLSNTNYKGEYSFSGYAIDTPPYSLKNEDITSIAAAGITMNNTGTTQTRSVGGQSYTYDVYNVQDANANRIDRMIPGSLSFTPTTATESMDPTKGDFYVDYAKGLVYVRQTPTAGVQPTMTGFDWIKPTDKDIDGDVQRQVEKGSLSTVKINVNAHEVFGDPNDPAGKEDTFQSVIRLMQGLQYSNTDEINTSIGGIDTGLQRVLSSAASIGARTNRLELNSDRLTDRETESQRLQSDLEDLDFSKAISDFSLAQAVLEASLNSAAKVLQPTLASYL